MFRGLNTVSIDAKGRLAIPVRYRETLNHESDGQLILTIDTENPCLLLYPVTEWEKIETKLQSLPSFNVQARRIQRLLIGHATEVDMDAQGRVLLPPVLRQYAGLDKQIALVGQGRKFEIWSDEQWQAGRDRWLAEEAGQSGDLPDELQAISL